MSGPSRVSVASGHHPARTSHGIAGGTPDNGTTLIPVVRPSKAHAGVLRSHGSVAASSETRPAGADVAAAPDNHGPETAPAGPVRLAVALSAQAALFALLGMLAWALLPLALGWVPTTVMTGSMEPRIAAGDVIIARPIPAGTATLGHVLLVEDPDHAGRLRLHRYVQDAPDGRLILRGDANPANDSSPVAPEAVHGVAVLRVPFVGLPVVWFAEKNWGNLAALFVAVSALTVAAAAGSGGPARDRRGPAQPGAGRGPLPTPHGHVPATRRAIRQRARAATRRTTAIRTLLCLASVPALITPQLLTAAPAHAAFSAATPSQAGSFASLGKYPCLSRTAQDNPVLFYAFNEASGPVVEDSSGNGGNGALSGAVARVPGSCAPDDSPAVALGGAAGFVSTPQLISAPDKFSLAIWFRTAPGTISGGRLLGFGSAQSGPSPLSDRHLYLTDAGRIGFGAATRNGTSEQFKASAITSPAAYSDGQWHLAAATMSPSGSVLYVDGVPVAASTGLVAERPYTGYWRVGYDSMDFDKNRDWPGAPTDSFFGGSVDSAAVYPVALNAGQIQAHYAAGR